MILNEFLKNSYQKMIDVYVKLFSIVFKSGVIPDLWSVGVICPIYKNKGDTANPDNYRGITILSCYGGCVPLLRQPVIPTAHYSDSPLFRQPITYSLL